jgi:hypothetical protein
VNEIPDCYESNKNFFGERTGVVFKSGELIFYSKYEYKNQNYNLKKSDGLYVTDENGSFNYKLADGIICSIVVRDDGVYYLKNKNKGEVFLYNYDLYRYSFESGKNELIISDCSYVQFSDDSVFYCQQYLSYKKFYVEYNKPLDLENEGKIVRHSLLTGEESVVAEIDGGIYHFLVGDGIIAFSGGAGNVYYGGQNLYTCNFDGSNLQQLTENDDGYVKILSVDKNQVIYSYCSTSLPDASAFCRMELDSKEVVWSYSVNELDGLGALFPIEFDGKLYFRMDSVYRDNVENKVICLDTRDALGNIEFIETPRIAYSLYVFNGKLYAAGSEAYPGASDLTNILKEFSGL